MFDSVAGRRRAPCRGRFCARGAGLKVEQHVVSSERILDRPHCIGRGIGRAGNTLSVSLSLVVLFSLVLIGCSSEPTTSTESSKDGRRVAGNRPPTIQIAIIEPQPIALNEPISVRVEAMDPDGDPVKFRHQWLANGKPIRGGTQPRLEPRMLKRGDMVSVEVTPIDWTTAGPRFKAEPVRVGNTPPVVDRLLIEPDVLRVGQTIRAKVEAEDADNDEITYVFNWWWNNEPQAEGENPEFDTAKFKRGDTVVVAVTPHDDSGPGKKVYSNELIIANSPPTISSSPPPPLDIGLYKYVVKASDPDGDPLTYKLESAPEGMTIEEQTGLIQWLISSRASGPQNVRVTVHDGHEGFGFQEFTITVPKPAA